MQNIARVWRCGAVPPPSSWPCCTFLFSAFCFTLSLLCVHLILYVIMAHICDDSPHSLSDGYKSRYRLDTRPSTKTWRSGYAQLLSSVMTSMKRSTFSENETPHSHLAMGLCSHKSLLKAPEALHRSSDTIWTSKCKKPLKSGLCCGAMPNSAHPNLPNSAHLVPKSGLHGLLLWCNAK